MKYLGLIFLFSKYNKIIIFYYFWLSFVFLSVVFTVIVYCLLLETFLIYFIIFRESLIRNLLMVLLFVFFELLIVVME